MKCEGCKEVYKLATTIVFAATLLLPGCDSRPSRVPVSGQVLIDGQPLKFGAVMFVPEKGRGSSGVLDENGHFVLTCYENNDGALVGKHSVRVIGGKPINDNVTEWFAPKKYSEVKTSELTQKITGPTDCIVINLTWKGDGHGKPYKEVLDPGASSGGGKRSPRE